MPTPQGIETVTLHGRFVEPDLTGTPLQGVLTFTPNVPMIMFPVQNTLMSGTETVTLDNQGEFFIDLPCTNTPGQNPDNWTYTVTEKLMGVRTRSYQIVLNSTQEVVELSDIMPTQQAPTYLPVVGAQGPPGVVTSVNGYSSAFVVLTSADVGAVPATGNSTIIGVKTFNSSPVVPVPTLDGDAATKSYVDALGTTVVKLTGNQSIAGTKTFTVIPVLPASDPTTANQATRKSYVDAGLALKANSSDVTSSLALKANSSDVNASLALKADDASVVKLSGDQTINGTKTFAGAVSFGSTLTSPQMRLTSSVDMSLTSVDHAFQIGPDNGLNLRADANELQALNNGAVSTLYIQPDGGPLGFFTSRAADSVADTLEVRGVVDANLLIGSRASATANILQTKADADTQPRFMMRADGLMNWGPGGTTATDTTLYRSSAGTLKTDGNLTVTGILTALVETSSTGATPGANFSILTYDARRIAGVVNISISLSYTGSTTITPDAGGNIVDVNCLTLPAGWRPRAPEVALWDKSGTALGGVYVGADGVCLLKTLNPGATVVSGSSVNFSLCFIP